MRATPICGRFNFHVACCPALQELFFIVNTATGLPWSTTVVPLRYATEFSTFMGLYRVVGSGPLYLALVLIACEGR